MTAVPFNTDLAPYDFFLFPIIKKKLRGFHFSTPEDAVNAFEDHVTAAFYGIILNDVKVREI